jgi:hypothetical protein
MDPAYVVLLIATAITIVAIAGYLIAIALILKRVVSRLVGVLGAVEAVTETAQPVGGLVDEINRDLDAGRKLIENAVERLEDSRVPVGAPADPPRHAAERHSPDAPGGGTATAAPPPPAPSHPDPPAEPPRERDPAPAPAEPPRERERGRGWFGR